MEKCLVATCVVNVTLLDNGTVLRVVKEEMCSGFMYQVVYKKSVMGFCSKNKAILL